MGTTTNYSWTTPTVGASDDTWGTTLNTTIQAIDTQMALAAFLAENETITGNWQFDGTFAATSTATFTGDVIVPASTTSTHALRVATADARYLSATGKDVWTKDASGSNASYNSTTPVSGSVTSMARAYRIEGYLDLNGSNRVLIEASDDGGSGWTTVFVGPGATLSAEKLYIRADITPIGVTGYGSIVTRVEQIALNSGGDAVLSVQGDNAESTGLTGIDTLRISASDSSQINAYNVVFLSRSLA